MENATKITWSNTAQSEQKLTEQSSNHSLKQKNKFLMIGGLIFVCFIIFGFSGFFLSNQLGSQQSNDDNLTQILPSPSMTFNDCNESTSKKYINTESDYKYEFCYPRDWKVAIGSYSTSDKNKYSLSITKQGDPSGLEYIQAQPLNFDLYGDYKSIFYQGSGTGVERVKDQEKYIVMKDNQYEFLTLKKVLSTSGELNTNIEYDFINPNNTKQFIRFWFFYEDSNPLDVVRDESRAFSKVTETFKWLD